MLSKLIGRIKAIARRRGWLTIIPILLIVEGVWDILVDTHTLSWLFEILRLPTIGWLGVVAMNHLGLVRLAMILIGLAWLGFLFRSPEPAITHPRNGDEVDSPMTVRGTHHNQTGNYWLVTDGGNWPKHKVDFGSGGLWGEQIHTGGGHTVTISLVKVSDLLRAMFEEYSREANRTQKWCKFPLPSPPPKKHITIVESIVVTVAPSPKP
jgi:hypothetical protein